jgi:PPP family 3-phenylpropionic acid transporter
LRTRFSISSIIKANYFVINMAGACLSYQVIYFESCGLSGFQIGLMGSSAALIMMLTQPLWGALVDHTRKTGRVLFFLTMTGALVESFYAFNGTFPAFLILTCLGAVFLGPGGPLLDSYTFHHLGASNRGFYAHFRIWGTYSFYFVSLGIGYLRDWLGLKALYLIVAAVFATVAMLCLFLEDVKLGELHEKESGFHLRGIRQLGGNRSFVLCLSCLFLASLADACVWPFLSLYFQTIGTPQRFISMAWAFAIPLEVLIFIYAPQILKRWGAPRMVQVGLVAMSLHWSMLYLFPYPWAAMFIQLLKGVAFAGSFVGAATMVDIMVPLKLKATGQSLLAAAGSLAVVIGSTTGGWLYDAIGIRNLCLVSGVLGALTLILFVWLVGGKKQGELSPT